MASKMAAKVTFDEDDDFSVGSDPDDIESSTATNSASSSSNKGEELAQKESRVVHVLRAVVLGVLLFTAVGVSVAIYRYTSGEETDDFQAAFHNHAAKVIESLKVNTAQQLIVIDSFASTVSAMARDGNMSWPFVTIPSFPLLGRSALSEIKGLSILLQTKVLPEEREEWNRYVAANHAIWVESDYAFKAEGGFNQALKLDTNDTQHTRMLQEEGQNEVDFSNGYSEDIAWGIFGPDGVPILERAPEDPPNGYFFPLWQNTPKPPNVAENVDILGPGVDGVFGAVVNNQAVSGPSFNTEGGFDSGSSFTDMLLEVWGRGDEAIGSDPLGSYTYPIHEQVDHGSSVVGALTTYVHWRQLFVDILPPDAVGVIAVFESTCDQRFTYQINGKDVVYLDQQDLHDPSYDHMMESIVLTDYFNANPPKLYYGVPIAKDAGCQYTLRVYPSKQLEDQYITKTPVYYTLGVVFIFLFATFVFVIYDFVVEYRQRLVMRNALRSGAIVSDMFPKEFREKMQEQEEEEKKRQQRNKKRAFMSNNRLLKSFADGSADDDIIGGKPVAELFTETTVMVSAFHPVCSSCGVVHPSRVSQ